MQLHPHERDLRALQWTLGSTSGRPRLLARQGVGPRELESAIDVHLDLSAQEADVDFVPAGVLHGRYEDLVDVVAVLEVHARSEPEGAVGPPVLPPALARPGVELDLGDLL